MKIVFLDAKTIGQDISLDIFKDFGKFVFYETTTNKQVIDRVKDANIIITNKVVIDKIAMDRADGLKLICVAATGMNNIDLEHASKKGIKVKNVEDYSTPSVAQHTFSMLFYLLEKSRYYDEYVKSKEWSKNDIFTHLNKPFFEIKGKKWGIIGLGNIGKEVAKIASGFSCKISYYSTSGKNNYDKYKKNRSRNFVKKERYHIHTCPVKQINKKPYNQKRTLYA